MRGRVALWILVLLFPLGWHPAWGQSTTVEPRTATNLLVCSWNIKWFRDAGRDLPDLAKVIAHFDLCGIVELQSDRVLKDLAKALAEETGEPWMYIQSDRTGKQPSHTEQFGFLWWDGKVRIASGHVGNVADFPRTHRRQPYIATFQSGNFDFRFLLIHTRWTTEPEPAAEVAQIARDFHWFQTLTTERDVILGGDFNCPATSPKMAPLTSLPDVVDLLPAGTKTTLKDSSQGFSASYDHMYVNRQATIEATGKGGAYDFLAGLGYTDTQQAKSEFSDHLPVWAEFRMDGPDDDCQRLNAPFRPTARLRTGGPEYDPRWVRLYLREIEGRRPAMGVGRRRKHRGQANWKGRLFLGYT